MFDSEYQAFSAYCEQYPDSPTLLADTYNTLKSGIPNAIRVFKEHGINKCAVRLDSGDISYLSKKARKMLDDAGLFECKIVASNSLDEYLIGTLISQGAKIDAFGVGERLITAKSDPVFGGVYKLAAVEDDNGRIIPKIKLSENISKITTPHFKKLYRYYDKHSGKALADELCVHDEIIDADAPRTIFDPDAVWKRKTLTDFTVKPLQVPVIKNGRLIYNLPGIAQIKKYCAEQLDMLWDEVKRFEHPHKYYVDLSQKLWDVKHRLLSESININ
jgi:nicotinate phosphoribosyltransferase